MQKTFHDSRPKKNTLNKYNNINGEQHKINSGRYTSLRARAQKIHADAIHLIGTDRTWHLGGNQLFGGRNLGMPT